MLKRNNLSYRRATSVGQKIPLDAPERAEAFLAEMKTASADYPMILNTDESACYFDLPRTTTYDLSGVKTTGHDKLRYSVVLTAGVQQVDGFKVVKLLKTKFPVGISVESTKGGTMTNDLMMNSIIPLFKKRLGIFFNQPETLLIMETATSHTTEVKQGFSNLKTM